MSLTPFAYRLFTDVRTYIILGAIGLALFSFKTYKENAYLTNQLQTVSSRSAQNERAWRDSTTKQAAQITNLAVFVRNLQTKLTQKNQELVVLQNFYTHVIDSIHTVDSSVVYAGEDSVGKYDSTSISGTESIATYSCFVKMYVTPMSKARKASWNVNINFAPIKTASSLNRDRDGLFTIETRSLTKGVNVIGYTILDSTAYPYLYKMVPQAEECPPQSVLFGGFMVDKAAVAPGLAIRLPEWLFIVNYRVFNKDQSSTANVWPTQFQIGVYKGIF